MSEDRSSASGPRTLVEWYRDARQVLCDCEAQVDRLAEDEASTEHGHLMAAARLSKQLVDLFEPEPGAD